jgi:hypothetical protein
MARNLQRSGPRCGRSPDHKSVHPPNNHAERALGGAVIYRKLRLGSQSAGASDASNGREAVNAHPRVELEHRLSS